MIQIKRVYDRQEPEDGARFLVDRLWPRGVKKEDLPMECWLKDVAPSNALRRWYGHDRDKWSEFRQRYYAELVDNPGAWRTLLNLARTRDITLLFSAHDQECNQAVALKSFLEERLS